MLFNVTFLILQRILCISVVKFPVQNHSRAQASACSYRKTYPERDGHVCDLICLSLPPPNALFLGFMKAELD